jgi:hypothetical protein
MITNLAKLDFFLGWPFLARLKKSVISKLLSVIASSCDDGGRCRGVVPWCFVLGISEHEMKLEQEL